MMSRPPFVSTDVATSADVATLISLQADVATASDVVLMSRPLIFFFINSWLPDLEFLSRPARFAFNYSSVVTGVLSLRP